MNGNNKGPIHIAFNKFAPPPPHLRHLRMPAAAVAPNWGAEGAGWFLNFNFSFLVSDATTNGGSKLRGTQWGRGASGARTQTPVCMAAAVLFD